MVNERQGKVYNPRPAYNRKLLRSVIRAGVQKQFGQHQILLTWRETLKKSERNR